MVLENATIHWVIGHIWEVMITLNLFDFVAFFFFFGNINRSHCTIQLGFFFYFLSKKFSVLAQ